MSAAALRAWLTPPPLSERPAIGDKQAPAGVERVTVPFQSGELAGFRIGEGPLERGNRVVAVDLPGHPCALPGGG